MKRKHHDLIVKWAADTSIEIEARNGGYDWTTVCHPLWEETQEYRIKPPEPKKIKLLAYLDLNEELRFVSETCPFTNEWHRIPELDKEVTLP